MILYQTFVVFVLWKKDGSKKWFPSVVGGGENPEGTVKKTDISIFCLGIREIVQSDFDKKIAYNSYGKSARDGGVEDGVNVCEYIG